LEDFYLGREILVQHERPEVDEPDTALAVLAVPELPERPEGAQYLP
jgi:hypothetical protein